MFTSQIKLDLSPKELTDYKEGIANGVSMGQRHFYDQQKRYYQSTFALYRANSENVAIIWAIKCAVRVAGTG